MTKKGQDQQTNTYGWDTVFAIPVKYVNEAIAFHKSSPKGFSLTTADGASITGSFGHWQVAHGGNGGLMWFTVPCLGIKYHHSLGNATWKDVDLTIQIRLRYIDAPGTPAPAAKVATRHLVVDHDNSNPMLPPVSQVNTKSNSQPIGPLATLLGVDNVEPVICGEIVEWLKENLSEFAHVFAIVDLNLDLAQTQQWAWAKPTDTGYAYENGTSLDDSLFGVLCMTGGRKAGIQQAFQVDKFAIPPACPGGYLIAQQRFLEDLVLPSIPAKYTNSSMDDYEIVAGGNTGTGKYTRNLRLKTDKSIKLTDIEHEGTTYTPYLTSYEIAMEGTTMTFSARTETDCGWNTTAWCTSVHKFEISLDQKTQQLGYREVGTASVQNGSESESTWIEKALSIFAAVVLTVILGLLTDGAGFFIGAVVIGLVCGVGGDTQEIVNAVNQDTSPDVNALAANIAGPIRWPLASKFELVTASLMGPLRLGGIPHFNTKKAARQFA